MSLVPAELVSLRELEPTIQVDLKYSTADNFVGRPLRGYLSPTCYLSLEAAKALVRIQKKLVPQGYGLKIFDGARPQRAVDDIVAWVGDPGDLKMKARFYPNIEKHRLIEMGYLSRRSSHSRGSAVDLTLVSRDSGFELDMGCEFDFFDTRAHFDASGLSEVQRQNRERLRGIMAEEGFRPYSKEWWHFTLINEPFPETYFDFEV